MEGEYIMDKKNKAALRFIYRNLKHGIRYGKYNFYDYYNCRPFPFPYFCVNLARRGNLLSWTHYGSSAEKFTLKDLEWIITVIFNTSPIDFLRDYTAENAIYIR